jgi:hypothetical protein
MWRRKDGVRVVLIALAETSVFTVHQSFSSAVLHIIDQAWKVPDGEMPLSLMSMQKLMVISETMGHRGLSPRCCCMVP